MPSNDDDVESKSSEEEDEEEQLKKTVLGEDGLPIMSEEEREKGAKKGKTMVAGMMLMISLISLGIAYLIYRFGNNSLYSEQIQKLLVPNQLGYLYISGYVFFQTVQWLNMFPMIAKSRIMKGSSGNLRANMGIYKLGYPDGSLRGMPYVVLETAGLVGEYNRANRSLTHFGENMGGMVVNMLLGGVIFSLPVMILVCIFALGRILHQWGYTYGYGSHGPGFMLSMLSTGVTSSLVLLAALGSFGVPL